MPRRYQQYCGLARALDDVGERWALLVVRELLGGPMRFKDLQDGLAGVGPNMLTERLKQMEEAGLVERTILPPPASVPVYRLTPRGRSLEPVVEALTAWGLQGLAPRETSDVTRGDWAVLALRSALDRDIADEVFETWQIELEDGTWSVHVARGAIEVAREVAPGASAEIETDAQTLIDLVSGRIEASSALASGRVTVRGRAGAWQRFVALFCAEAPHMAELREVG